MGMQSPRSIQQLLAQPKNTHLVKELLGQEAALSRSELARELCRRLDLRDPKGHARIATTAKALRDLAAQGCWTLPAATVPAQRGWTPISVNLKIGNFPQRRHLHLAFSFGTARAGGEHVGRRAELRQGQWGGQRRHHRIAGLLVHVPTRLLIPSGRCRGKNSGYHTAGFQ